MGLSTGFLPFRWSNSLGAFKCKLIAKRWRRTVVGVEQFLEDLKAKAEPIGVGLITLNPNAPGPTLVVQVENPRFLHPFPVQFDYPIKELLSCPFEILENVVADKKAVPIDEMFFWWSYAIYE